MGGKIKDSSVRMFRKADKPGFQTVAVVIAPGAGFCRKTRMLRYCPAACIVSESRHAPRGIRTVRKRSVPARSPVRRGRSEDWIRSRTRCARCCSIRKCCGCRNADGQERSAHRLFPSVRSVFCSTRRTTGGMRRSAAGPHSSCRIHAGYRRIPVWIPGRKRFLRQVPSGLRRF